jgi:hypothetical protein
LALHWHRQFKKVNLRTFKSDFFTISRIFKALSCADGMHHSMKVYMGFKGIFLFLLDFVGDSLLQFVQKNASLHESVHGISRHFFILQDFVGDFFEIFGLFWI